jgi:hypothetical protein
MQPRLAAASTSAARRAAFALPRRVPLRRPLSSLKERFMDKSNPYNKIVSDLKGAPVSDVSAADAAWRGRERRVSAQPFCRRSLRLLSAYTRSAAPFRTRAHALGVRLSEPQRVRLRAHTHSRAHARPPTRSSPRKSCATAPGDPGCTRSSFAAARGTPR